MRSFVRPLSANWYRLIYAATIFLSAFLLFQVQLIVSKYILPWYGGSASVWSTSLLFFQFLLLVGYCYSHLSVSHLCFKWQARLHLGLLATALLIMAVLLIRWGSPILAAESWRPSSSEANPISEIILLLSASVGVPFLLLSATSPLLQRWFGQLQPNRSPYRLYALSNLGSLLGVLSYPFLVESFLKLSTQAWMWTLLYFTFALSCSVCALPILGQKNQESPHQKRFEATAIQQFRSVSILFWFGLAFCTTTLLLAVTNQICQEMAVTPFLWVLPLSLYLISFSICFHREKWYRRRLFLSLMALGTVLSLDILSASLKRALTDQIVVFSLFLFASCMVCHGELVRRKPPRDYLTHFYLMIALGGVGGGFFVGYVAPQFFSGYWELHLGILLSWILVFVSLLRDKTSFMHCPSVRFSLLFLTVTVIAAAYLMTYPLPDSLRNLSGDSYLYYGLAGLLALVSDSLLQVRNSLPSFPTVHRSVLLGLGMLGFIFFTSRAAGSSESLCRTRWGIRTIWTVLLAILGLGLWANVSGYYKNTVSLSRSFYGVTKVVEKKGQSGDPTYSLFHGQTLHGLQLAEHRKLPTTYFGDRSGIGILMLNYSPGPVRRVGILGLGIGTLAVYGTPRDIFRFYEINPDVIRIANGAGGYFSYLGDSGATIEIVEGDARVALEREPKNPGLEPFDILVLDVFNSDSIPVHLLTKEAFEIYLKRLQPTGVLAIHITNRFLDLKPVVYGIADSFGLHRALIHNLPRDSTDQMSTWVLLSYENSHFDQPPISLVGLAETDQIETRLWTDDFSNLFQVMRF